jgi:PAS domain S-box-containing protein
MNYPTTKDLQEVNESLQDERNFVSAVLDKFDAIVVVLNPNRNVVKVNPLFECLTSYTLDDMKGGNFFNGFLHSNQVEKVTERLLNNFNNPELPNHYESHIITKGGDLILFHGQIRC